MDSNDRQAIEALFVKLSAVERQATPRDAQADAFIRDAIARQPGAPYYMAQTVVVQEAALEAAQARIEALEADLESARNPRRASPFSRSEQGSPWQRATPGGTAAAQPRAGGGFLAGAAQTAMGVAGGLLLGNAIGGLFGGGAAAAAEPEPEPEADAGLEEDAGWDDMEM